ncbi:MAG: carbohydrate kinase PfkB family [Gammaproteobacteria bacterium]|jgi:sugar/nucleoside kinase (ribokinase family)|nr:carbohydrate kinase PfkB family [Gammaproteobacteria bacterium]
MKQYHVYGMGNALLDIEFEVYPEFFAENGIEKGVMTLVDEARQSLILRKLGLANHRKIASGGSAANTMIALQLFGSKGFYTCKIANDEAGDHYYREMRAAGLDSTFDTQVRQAGHTGKCLAMITHDADRTMNTFLGISETLSEHELNVEALKNSEYLYIEGYLMTSPTALHAVKKAKSIAQAYGIKTSISLSDPAIVKYFKSQFLEVTKEGVDLLFCNQEEAYEFCDTRDLEVVKETLTTVAKSFVITCGSKGSIVFDGSKFIEIAPFPVHAVDTLGAGDMYAGAFLAAITQGYPCELAGKLASLTSAKVVTQYGPRLSQDDINHIKSQVFEVEQAV